MMQRTIRQLGRCKIIQPAGTTANLRIRPTVPVTLDAQNYVGAVVELCQAKKAPLPIFEVQPVEGEHARHVCLCTHAFERSGNS